MIVCFTEEEQVPAIPGLPAVPPRKVSLTPKKITPPPPPPKNPLLKGKKLNKEECCLWDLTDKFRVTAHSVTNVAYQNHSKVLSSSLGWSHCLLSCMLPYFFQPPKLNIISHIPSFQFCVFFPFFISHAQCQCRLFFCGRKIYCDFLMVLK